jgi:YfiR/HmsC-like
MEMALSSGADPKQFPIAASPPKEMRPRSGRWRLGGYLLLAGLALLPMRASAQEYRSGEYELKAAILFNLVKFVEWPAAAYPGAQAPTVLCTLGRDPFGSALDQFAGNTVNGRPLMIRRLQRDDDASGCHLVYISSSERKLLRQLLKTLQGGPILTVGETEQFAIRGGMIQLSVENKQVHFTINLSAASREQLRIRSNLLALSRIVGSNVSLGTQTGLFP